MAEAMPVIAAIDGSPASLAVLRQGQAIAGRRRTRPLSSAHLAIVPRTDNGSSLPGPGH
jgi:hypothetical protein